MRYARRRKMRLARWKKWLLIVIAVGGALWLYDSRRAWKENSHDDIIRAAATQYGVDPALIKAVIWRESRFDPKAKGSKGEVGLMQIMPGAASDWAKAEKRTIVFHAELFDRQKNVQCGTWYLRWLWQRYRHTDNPMPYTLADYNAGRGNVLKWLDGAAATNSLAFIEQIGFPSTKDYVKSVMARHEKYRSQFPRPKP